MKPSPSRCRCLLLLASTLLTVLAAANAAAGGAAKGGSSGASGLSLLNMGSDRLDLGQDLYLEVVLNGEAIGQLAHFGQRDGQLLASVSTLRGLDFVLPPDAPDPLALDTLPGVSVDYDEARQLVRINAPLAMLDLDTNVLNDPTRGSVPEATTSPGLLLNYDLYGSAGEKSSGSLSAYSELRAFSDMGVFSNSALSRAIREQGGNWRADSVRLDTSWRTSFPERMLGLTIGDTLTSALDWSRPTHIAGVQLSRDFDLQPYRITTPIPSFLGQAALPSAIELYVNGIRQYSGNVEPGPFEIHGAPIINGNGTAQVVLTDISGRSTAISFPFYTSGQLLQAGLSDWSAELGVVRQNYARESFDYADDPALSASWRHGVNDRFTAEAHAEATADLANAGIGGTVLLGYAGVLSGSFAHSSNEGDTGSQYSLGYQWRSGRFNAAISSTRTDGEYRDVASLHGTPPPRISERALLGLNTRRAGSFSLSYIHLAQTEQDTARYASGHWFRSFGNRLSLSLGFNQNLDNHADRSIFLGLSLSLDNHVSLGASAERDHGRSSFTLDAGKPVPGDGGFGWRAQARSGEVSGGLAEVNYRGIHGQVGAGIHAWDSDRYAYAHANGALVMLGGHVFTSRRIDEAFAVVSTDGIAGVPVKLENRVIGNTDENGMLLVTPLNAYQGNQLAIDPMDLPANLRIQHVKSIAVPADRSGTLVRFGIEPVRAASVLLVNTRGTPLPLGSRVHISADDNQQALVGFDGMVYLDELQMQNSLQVETPAGSCHVSFDYPQDSDGIPLIGPLVCTQRTAP